MANIHIRFLRIAVIYLLAGMVLGLAMGISGDHSLYPAHAHINLVGWASFVLYALIYRVFPSAALSGLAPLHFWLANLGALVLCVGVLGINAGHESFVPVAAVGSIVTLLGAVVFAVILFRNITAGELARPQ